MSDQFNRQKITREIARMRVAATEANDELVELRASFKRLWIECESLKQQRDDLKRFAYEEAPKIAAEEANKQTADLRVEVERLRLELTYIADAQRKNFADAEEFRTWAQNRARHAIGWKPGELAIKKEKP